MYWALIQNSLKLKALKLVYWSRSSRDYQMEKKIRNHQKPEEEEEVIVVRTKKKRALV